MSRGATPEDKEKRGFGGLADMVSDVETPVRATPTSTTPPLQTRPVSDAAPPTGGRAPAPAAPSPPAPYPRTAQQARPSNGRKWLIGVAVVLAIAWMIAQSSGKKASPARGSSGSPRPAPRVASAPKPLDETKPPPGSNLVLSTSQIRYCLAEDIRLGAAKSAVNAYSDAEVGRFNAMVTDYNIRCGEYRYRQGTLESARSEVGRHRAELELEGRSRFQAPRDSAAALSRTGPEEQAIDWNALLAEFAEREVRQKPVPDSTVLSVQQGLTALGYDAGPADGVMGERTRKAILEFQRKQGIIADGVATASLLQHLNRVRQETPKEVTKHVETAPPRTATTPQPLHVGGDVKPPVRLSGPMPTYTEGALKAGLEGSVVLETVINEDGSVTILRTKRGLPHGLVKAAWDAVLQWRYSPATSGGRPVAVYYTLTVRFELRKPVVR